MAMGGGAETLTAIVNAGKTAWDIMKDGAAQSSAASSFCSALPAGVRSSGGRSKSRRWRIRATNLYGAEVVNVELVYRFSYNIEDPDEPGSRYVHNFTVFPGSVTVLWGYSVDVRATVSGRPENIAGRGRPRIGAIPLLIRASYGSILVRKSRTWLLLARGDGGLDVT